MRNLVKWAGLTIGAVVGLLLLGIAAGVLFFDWNWFKDAIVARASEATGRKVTIAGDIQGEFAFTPRIRIGGIRIENTPWGKATDMVEIESVDFKIALLELLRGRIEIPDLKVAGAKISLEKNSDGAANWNFDPSVAGAAKEVVVPDDRQEFPIIGRLSVENSRIGYRDAQQDIDISGRIADLEGSPARPHRVRLEGDGRFRGRSFDLDLTAGSILQLREGEDPYPIDLTLNVGQTVLAAKGTANAPLDMDGLDFALDIAGDNLADLYLITGIPLPPTAAYKIRGRLGRRADVWTMEKLDGRVGASDLAGNLTVDVASEQPVMTAELTSRKLDFKDLGGFIGAPPDPSSDGQKTKADKRQTGAGPARPERVLPDVPIDLERLNAMDMQVKFKGKRVLAPNLPIDDLDAELYLKNGRLTLKPLTLGFAGGSVNGIVTLDGREKPPAIDAALTLRGLALKPFVKELDLDDMGDLTSGRFGGNIKLSGRGGTFADFLGASDGRVTVAMEGGTLDPIVVELIGLDIAQSLAIAIKEGQPVKIRCILGDLSVKRGVMKVNGLGADTSDSNIWVNGDVDLKDESLNLRVHANPKDVSLLSANAPIAVGGTFADPTIAIDTLGTTGTGGATEAIGKIVNPILALLPFVDLGLAEDTACKDFSTQSETLGPSKN